MKNKLLLFLLMCLITMPCVGKITKIEDSNAALTKNKKNNAVVTKKKKTNPVVIKKKKTSTAITPKKITANKKRSAAIVAKNAKLNINARILFASQTTQKNKSANSQLENCEKELTGYLDYNDYKLLQSGSKTTKIKSSYKIKFSRGGSVKITPLSSNNGRIKAKVVWNVPGKKTWSKTLNFKKGKRSIISGPKDKKGGMYLMSMEIN